MEDILQVLQTSWPILLMVVIFYFLLEFMCQMRQAILEDRFPQFRMQFWDSFKK